MNIFLKVVGLCALAFGIFLVLQCVGFIGSYVEDTSKTVYNEVSPQQLLKKYTWFKDSSATLDKYKSDIEVYQDRIDAMNKILNPSRSDKEQMYVWMSEVAGIKAGYNQLASEYNSKMSQIQWAFCEVGKLPKGAENPLPREYKPYITK